MMDPPSTNTFRVDESRSLTLFRESLAIHDDCSSGDNANRSCCGLLSSKDPGPKNIGFDAILNAHLSPKGLTIAYLDKEYPSNAPINALQYPVQPEQTEKATIWIDRLLYRAYGSAQRHKRLKVLVNPFCGSALTNFRALVAPIFAAAHCEVDLEETRHRGHASEIAETIAIDSYDAIVCCSGDGLPYEVFNGLARRPDALDALSNMAVAMIPCGSGNAMAWNLFGTDDPSLAALGIVKGLEMPLDLASITQGERHTVSFLSQAFGVLADSDLKTEHLRWMGDNRFIYGVLATLARNTKYPCQIAFKSATGNESKLEKQSRKTSKESSTSLPLQYGTVLEDIPQDWEIMPREKMASFYTGNMRIVAKDTNFFPNALPNDGSLDMMMVDDTIGYAGALEAIIKLPQGRCHELKDVEMRKVTAYRMTPWKQDGDISVDGERYPFEAFQVEVHQGLGRVLSKSGNSYEKLDV